jgi:hypothetical protein
LGRQFHCRPKAGVQPEKINPLEWRISRRSNGFFYVVLG